MPAFAQVPAVMPESKKIQVVLYRLDPWLNTIGSDSPVFALYSDGTVIYCKTDSTTYEPSCFSATLTAEQAMRMYSDLGALSNDSGYSLNDASDQPRNLLIWLQPDGSNKSVLVEGDLVRDTTANTTAKTLVGNFYISNPALEQNTSSKSELLRIPGHVLKIFRELLSFEAKDAKPWLPIYIELLLKPGGAPGGFEWPHDWPDLQDKFTKQRKADNYSVFLKSEHFAELKVLMTKTPFARINGRSWSVDCRFPFPQEYVLYPRGPANFQPIP
jgi:hypothetical protein